MTAAAAKLEEVEAGSTSDAKAKKLADEEDDDDELLYDVVTFYLPLAALAVVALIFIGFSIIGWDKVFARVFDLVESSETRLLQVLVINGLLILTTVCALPAPAFYIMLNGFFFGFLRGAVISLCAMLTAALISFWIAHSCLKDRVRRYLTKNPTTHDVMRVLDEDHTGKFLVLFRFVFIPGFVKNYSMSMLDISALKFVLVSLPGEIFYASLFAYIGSLAYKVIDKLRRGNVEAATSQFSGFEVWMATISGLVFVLLVVFAWREYNQRKADMDHDEEREPLTKGVTTIGKTDNTPA